LITNIEMFEKESRKFQPFNHFNSRILEMENKSRYGAQVASKWATATRLFEQLLLFPLIMIIFLEINLIKYYKRIF